MPTSITTRPASFRMRGPATAGGVFGAGSRLGEAWSRLEWDVQDLIDVGDDRVLAGSLRGEGRGSGVKLEGDSTRARGCDTGASRIEDHLTLSGALHALGRRWTLEAVGLRE